MMNWGWHQYLEKSRDLKKMKNSDETVQALEKHLAESNYPPQTLSLSSWIHEQCLCHLMLLTTGHLETKLYCWFQLYLPLFLPTSKSKWIIEHENKEGILIEKIKPIPMKKELLEFLCTTEDYKGVKASFYKQHK